MAGVELNPEEQINYGIKLIIEAYENRSKIYENEIKLLNEEIHQRDLKIYELENKYIQMEKDKEIFEENVARVIDENNYLIEVSNNLSNENKKLEKFKSSILESIENNEIIKSENFKTIQNENKKVKLNTNMNMNYIPSMTFNNYTSASKFSNANNYLETLSDSGKKNKKFNLNKNEKISIKNSFESSEVSSIKNNKDLNIENLIEKLNISINSKVKNLSNEEAESRNFNLKKKKNQKVEIKSLREDSIDDENNLDSFTESRKETEKSNQYLFSSNFFAECRMNLKKNEYSKIIDTLKLCNNNKIEKDEALKRIDRILDKYDKLKKDLRKIFPSIGE